MTEKIKHRPVVNDPIQSHADSLEEIIQIPPAATEGRDVADRGNRRLNNALPNLSARFLSRHAQGVGWVLAADPVKAEVLQHLLYIWPIHEPITEFPRGAEAGRVDSNSSLQGNVRQANVFADHFLRAFALDQPGGTTKAKLDVPGFGGFDVDVVVGVIADGMASLIDLFEPIDFFLLEDASHGETMHDAAVAFYPPQASSVYFLVSSLRLPFL